MTTPKFDNLTTPQRDSYFILENDVYREHRSGLAKILNVLGLQAGKYQAVAEDDEGIYYACEKVCLFNLSEERALRYLETGEISNAALARTRGGLWVPKKGVSSETKVFNILDSVDVGSNNLTTKAILDWERGRVGFLELSGGLEALREVKIVDVNE